MTKRLEPTRDERGSALLLSLILIFVMTLLGLALFDHSVVETRLVLASQNDTRAFEIAQTGAERAIAKLQQTINSGTNSWATGTPAICTGGTHRGCSDSRFYPPADGYIPNVNFDNGSYSLEFMLVTDTSVSVPCNKDLAATSDVDASKKICKDLIFIRSTGTLTNRPPGYTPTRTVQLLATAAPGSCLLCGGLTGSASTGLPINGNVKIAGNILIGGVDGTRSLDLGGTSLQSNSYAALDLSSLQRIKTLPLVCPFGRTCNADSDRVESLGATLRVARPTDIPAVRLSGNANLGQNGDQTYSADASRKGKGPLDGIFVADGCAMPCTDNFTGVTVNSTAFVDDNNITKPYQGPIGAFPQLTDSWFVNGTKYTHFACVYGSSCTPPGSPTTQEFFVSRAAYICQPMSASCPTPLPDINCVPSPGCAPIITTLSNTGLSDGVGPFEMTVSFVNQSGATATGKVCWDRAKTPLPAGVTTPAHPGLPRFTLEFGSPNCDTPTPPSNPVLLYMPSATPNTTGLTINRSGGPSDYSFLGSAIIVTNGLVQIEESLQSCQTTTSGTACFNSQLNGGPDLFTRDSSLTVMTFGGAGCGATSCGNMNLGKNASGINRIMGLFFAGCDPTDSACGTTKGVETSQKQTNIVGSVTGYRLCFAGGASPCSAGGNVPSFFQVLQDPFNLVSTITTGGKFKVASVPRYWVECKRTPNADGTYPALPNAFCPYTP